MLRPKLLQTRLLFFFFLVFSLGCKQEARQASEGLYIVATTGMIRDAVAMIAGEKAQVEGLMGPGVDPHLYRATPGDLQKMRQANVIFYNGLHLEGNMADVLEKLSNKQPVFAVADGIPKNRLIVADEAGNSLDPHIWFDAQLWKEAVVHIGAKLSEIDPAHADWYTSRVQQYSDSLITLDQETREKIATIPEKQRVLITAHDAFTYFGRSYQIEVRGLQGISTLSEFGLKDISELVTFITDRQIKAVFVESSVPAKSLEAVLSGCQEKGHQVVIGGTLYSDAMGADDTPEGSYMGMFRHNVNTIVNALK